MSVLLVGVIMTSRPFPATVVGPPCAGGPRRAAALLTAANAADRRASSAEEDWASFEADFAWDLLVLAARRCSIKGVIRG